MSNQYRNIATINYCIVLYVDCIDIVPVFQCFIVSHQKMFLYHTESILSRTRSQILSLWDLVLNFFKVFQPARVQTRTI